jgi:hypothetical protein
MQVLQHAAPVTVAGLVQGMNYLGLLGCWDRRFKSYSRHGFLCVCVRLFFVCVVQGR